MFLAMEIDGITVHIESHLLQSIADGEGELRFAMGSLGELTIGLRSRT